MDKGQAILAFSGVPEAVRVQRLQSRAEYIRGKLNAGMRGLGWDWELVEALEWSIKQISLLEDLCAGTVRPFKRRFERLEGIPDSMPISGRAGAARLRRLRDRANFLQTTRLVRPGVDGYASAEVSAIEWSIARIVFLENQTKRTN
jgi:hypothetical protein